MGAAKNYYSDAGREVVGHVADAAKRAAQAAKDAFNKARTSA